MEVFAERATRGDSMSPTTPISPKDLLTDQDGLPPYPSPMGPPQRCGTCRHGAMLYVVRGSPNNPMRPHGELQLVATHGLAGFADSTPVPGKRACTEPTLYGALKELHIVNDVAFCSAWEDGT